MQVKVLGRVVTEKIPMQFCGRKRTVNIYLPTGYDDSGLRYPVIYVLDGESALLCKAAKPEWSFCFDKAVDTTAVDGFAGAIVVAIESCNEYKDLFEHYNYPRDNEYSFNYGDWRGWGEDFAWWLNYELKPRIDNRYRTLFGREHTCICGSSLTATYTLWLALKYPERFSMFAAFSPGLSFADGVDMASYWPQFSSLGKPDLPVRLYMEVGTEENVPGGGTSNERYLADVKRFYENYLLPRGFRADELMFKVIPDGHHTTECWQKNVVSALTWLFRTEMPIAKKISADSIKEA